MKRLPLYPVIQAYKLQIHCGCGVAHTVANTTPVREDLGSILHPNPGAVFFQKLSSPFFQTTDLKTIHSFVILWCQVEKKKITNPLNPFSRSLDVWRRFGWHCFQDLGWKLKYRNFFLSLSLSLFLSFFLSLSLSIFLSLFLSFFLSESWSRRIRGE